MKINKIEVLLMVFFLLFIVSFPIYAENSTMKQYITLMNEEGIDTPCELHEKIDDRVVFIMDAENSRVTCNGSSVYHNGTVGFMTTDNCVSWYTSENGKIENSWLWMNDDTGNIRSFFNYDRAEFSILGNSMDVRIASGNGEVTEFKSTFGWIAYSAKEADHVATFLASPDYGHHFYVDSMDSIRASSIGDTVISVSGGNIISNGEQHPITDPMLTDTEYDGVKMLTYVRDNGFTSDETEPATNMTPYILILPHTIDTFKVLGLTTQVLVPIYSVATVVFLTLMLLVRLFRRE